MIFSIGVIVVLILSMGMSCFIFMWQKDKKKVTRTSKVVGKVHEIYIYPIKSCAGIKVHSANVTSSGLAYGEYCSDRAWAIVREGTIDTSEKAIAHNVNCTVMTIRQLSKMVLVQPSFSKVNGNLVITVPSSGETVEVPIRSSGIEWRCLLWDTPVKGIDQGSRVSNLLTSFLKSKEQLHLVYMGNKNFRYLKDTPKYSPLARESDTARFSDWSTFSMLSKQSLMWLNERLAEADISPAYPETFRHNIILDSRSGKAFEEDDIDTFHVEDSTRNNTDSSNESMFKVVKKVARCTVPTVNPHTGIKDTKFKLLNLLKKLRAQRYPHIPKESPYYSPEAMFGVNINLTDSGEAKIGSNLSQPNTIHTGDTIFVDEWNENPLPFLTGAMNPFTQ